MQPLHPREKKRFKLIKFLIHLTQCLFICEKLSREREREREREITVWFSFQISILYSKMRDLSMIRWKW